VARRSSVPNNEIFFLFALARCCTACVRRLRMRLLRPLAALILAALTVAQVWLTEKSILLTSSGPAAAAGPALRFLVPFGLFSFSLLQLPFSLTDLLPLVLRKVQHQHGKKRLGTRREIENPNEQNGMSRC
jgi:hypothetical protein